MPLLPHHEQTVCDPLGLGERSLAVKASCVMVGTLALTLASWVSLPMVPVPVTMQSFAVTMIGALYGWRLGALTILAWLGAALLGFPVLAGSASGIAPFMGLTAGYLLSFPIMAALVGWLAERGWSGDRIVYSFAAHLAGNALGLTLGGAWLAVLLGAQEGLSLGVAPFILGAILKSALAAAVLTGVKIYGDKARLI
ncbi:biotin transporter BioY [Rhizobium sp. BK602]|uniref:biotin transporter BioY n=1 Tax=Rhizobium sp. BK602 TaxID=2586986 RepID=UPI001620AF69|nr:biotin transporter BioY [Rhizobium sp. BK602]MBB3608590.1 biotin transport system substrate-specific component [Rhizobium sp. BK602]